MLGVGLESGFGSAKIVFDKVCAIVMKHLSATRTQDVILSVVFLSPSSPLPCVVTQPKITKIGRGRTYSRAVVPVPKEAANWDHKESLEFLIESVREIYSLLETKLALPKEITVTFNSILQELKTIGTEQ